MSHKDGLSPENDPHKTSGLCMHCVTRRVRRMSSISTKLTVSCRHSFHTTIKIDNQASEKLRNSWKLSSGLIKYSSSSFYHNINLTWSIYSIIIIYTSHGVFIHVFAKTSTSASIPTSLYRDDVYLIAFLVAIFKFINVAGFSIPTHLYETTHSKRRRY